MNRLVANVVGIVALVCVWLEPAVAFAGDGGASDGFEYVQPGGLTVLIGYFLFKVNQVAGPLKKLANNGKLSVTTEGFEEQQAEFDAEIKAATDEHAAETAALQAENDGLRAEVERLKAAQEMAAELDDLRRQREADAARFAATQAELAVAQAKVEAYERLVEFEKRLNGEESHDGEPED
jgi:DNA repair ATPase RecN